MTKENSPNKIKSLCAMAMLTALAAAADVFLRLPNIGGFLTYEPKDVILTIGGFIFGAVPGIIMSIAVCFIEMISVSSTGFIGLLMNSLSSVVFVGVASLIYQRKKTMSRAIIGLAAGSGSMIVIMLLWNYIMTPIFMGISREEVLALFFPLLIPFNTIKAVLNSALVLLLYKGVVTALRKSHLVPSRASNDGLNKRANTATVVVVSALVVATLVFVLLIFADVI